MRNEMLRMFTRMFSTITRISWSGLGPVMTIASSLTSFSFKTLTRPTKHLLYDMFVCRTDSVIFMLICRVQAYFGVSELPGQDDRRHRPSRSVPHDMEEAVSQNAPSFMTFQPKSVASFA